jgi:HAMP domain-containing protein
MENSILEVSSSAARDIRQGTMDMLMENILVLQSLLLDPGLMDYALNLDLANLNSAEMAEAMEMLGRLQSLTESTPSLEEIVLHDSNGMVVVSTGLGNIGQNDSSRADVQDVIQGSTFSESILLQGQNEIPSMFISIPLVGESGDTGVVSLQLQADFIQTFIDEISGQSGVNIYVVDTNGVILAESEHSQIWVYRSAQDLDTETASRYQTAESGSIPVYAPGIAALYQAVEMAFETGTTGRFSFCHPADLEHASQVDCSNGEWSQASYEIVPDPIHQTPLFLVLVEVMEGPYRQAARLQTLWSILTALLLGVVLVFASVRVARSMASPIQRMAEAAEMVETEQVFTPDSLEDISAQGDELGMLARVFSKMVLAVQKRERALKSEVRRLRIQIDEKKKQAEVDQISSQEFFQDLQKKAKGFKRNRQESDGEEEDE